MRKMRIALWSLEHMHAYSYARCLSAMDDVELIGAVDDDQDRLESARRRLGLDPLTVEELWRLQPDAVIVCSANTKHRAMVEEAASHGVSVLCEKPIATTLEDAHAMIDACAKAEVTLAMAFPCRLNVPIARGREIVRSGRIGRLIAANTTNHGRLPGGWFTDEALSGGGAVMDHTAHVADLLRWYTEAEIEEVYAEAGTLIHDIPTEDCALISMRLSDGTFATLDCSWSRPEAMPTWGDVTMHLIGTEGVLEVDAFRQRILVVGGGEAGLVWEGWGDDMDALLLRDFVDALAGGRKPAAVGEDGAASLAVTLAAYESIRTGKPAEVKHL